MVKTIGPVILDLASTTLDQEEMEILQHPAVGGVILFARNYENPRQIKELCAQIRSRRQKPLLIAVDQEGGRVQRFREGFSILPPMGHLGEEYEAAPQRALQRTEDLGQQMAKELLSVGIDFSFAPVLDLNKNLNAVIGDRAFHEKPTIVSELAIALMNGMRKAGMAATGKHFPGHGSVNLDSHLALPVDSRDIATLMKEDLIPFVHLIKAGIDAMMPAHIIFSAVDALPAGFSPYWLKKILRKQLKFEGVIISDDLTMEGASIVGNHADRAKVALEAGCDFVLICNHRAGAIAALDQLSAYFQVNADKFKKLEGNFNEHH
jgi:beta-N-acetylhexosaminidase